MDNCAQNDTGDSYDIGTIQIIDSYNISGPSPTNDTGDSYTIRHNWVRNVIRDKLWYCYH